MRVFATRKRLDFCSMDVSTMLMGLQKGLAQKQEVSIWRVDYPSFKDGISTDNGED